MTKKTYRKIGFDSEEEESIMREATLRGLTFSETVRQLLRETPKLTTLQANISLMLRKQDAILENLGQKK